MNIDSAKAENKRTVYIGMILSILLSVIFIAGMKNAYGIGIINDEFGYWGIAASFAGKDWSELLSTTPYYAYGYSMIVTWLYHIFDDPTVIYRVALIMNVIMIVFSFWIAYKCGKIMFPHLSSECILLVCFAITVYSNNIIQAQIAWTETLLYMLYWLTFYVFLSIIEKTETKYIIIFACLNAYMYFVHQRTLGVILTSSIMIIVLLITKKISIKQVVFYCGIIIALFWAGENIKADIIEWLFTNKELTAMNNYSGQVSKVGDIVHSLKGFMLLIQSVLGKLFYLGLSTFLIGFVSLFLLAKQSLFGGIAFLKSKLKRMDDRTMIALYLFLSYMATFMIAAISMYQPYGRLDLLLYGRYMEFAIGPLLLIGIVAVIQKKVKLHFYIISIICLILTAIMVNTVYLSLETSIYNGICISTLVYFFDNMKQVNGLSYQIVIIITAIILLIIMLLQNKNSKRNVSLIIVILLAVSWIKLGDYDGIGNLQKSVKNNVKTISEKIAGLEGQYDIYVLKDETGINTIAKYFQYYLPEFAVHIVDNIDEEKENALYIADKDRYELYKNKIILEKKNDITVFTSNKNRNILNKWSAE